jgi:3-hydroxyisobutyrate dehydrogenase-like beta-hydroxyacid dehydrogenase
MAAVAVIGLGAMGSRIARRLLAGGYELRVWNRSAGRLEPLLKAGAEAAATPREAALGSHMLITMLADPEALQAVSEGPDGIAAGAHPGLTVIEMSTVGPAAIQRLASTLPGEVRLVDAPMLGSIAEAEAGTLTIFAGGPVDAVDAVEPLLSELGALVRAGPLGAGAAAKLVANASMFGTLTVLGEVLAFADGLGLERQVSAAVLSSTPLAGQAKRRLPAVESGAYPRRFALSLARKDAELIREAAENAGVETPALDAAHHWLSAAELAGRGGEDYVAMLATILGGVLSVTPAPRVAFAEGAVGAGGVRSPSGGRSEAGR